MWGQSLVEENRISLEVVTPDRFISILADRVSPDVTLERVTAIATAI